MKTTKKYLLRIYDPVGRVIYEDDIYSENLEEARKLKARILKEITNELYSEIVDDDIEIKLEQNLEEVVGDLE